MVILVTTACVLLVPLIAMQFTKEVNWTGGDFLAAGMLLAGTGLLCEWVLRMVTKTSYRIALCALILVFCLLVWVELAVGIFGSPFAGN